MVDAPSPPAVPTSRAPEGVPLPEGFDPIAQARELVFTGRAASLGTLDKDGAPFASLVALATDHDGAPIIITSHLSHHTGHMERDRRVSLLVADLGRGDPLAHPRVTLQALACAARPGTPSYDRLRRRYLARHPKAQLYVDLPGFWFWRLEPTGLALNGGFGRAWSGPWSAIAIDLEGADTLLEAEGGALDHLNEDHADALALYATRLLGEAPGPWRAAGLDPEGLHLAAGDRVARLTFPRRVASPGVLRMVLKELADAARLRKPSP